MDLSSKKTVKKILNKYNIRPSKKFGQNFLIDKSVSRKVIKSADLKSRDTVLEIGPGIGTLTQEIAKKVSKVIAVEKDPKMCEIIKETLKDFKNIKVVNNDILKLQITNHKPEHKNFVLGRAHKYGLWFQTKYKLQITKNYKIVANLPFYLTAVAIRKFLEADNPPKEMVLIIQKEVGQRICANPPKMNLLAVSVQFYSKVKIIDYICKSSFWPEPKVDSAIIKIVSRQVKFSRQFRDQFFRIVKIGFSHPRKQILNNFEKGLKLNKQQIHKWLAKNNINPSQRAETLALQDWLNLVKMLK